MTTAIEVSNLEKTYSNGFQALKGITLSVQKGDFFALLGPNGAGKSTTIGILSSLVKKTAGSVKIFGIDVDKNFAAAKMKVGIVPQEFNFNMFEKVYDIVANQAGYYGLPRAQVKERVERYLKQLGLWEKQDQMARFLSGGMKRRLMIARALVHEPELLILDEPTAGVDIELRRSMWEFIQQINEQGTTIILTTHYLEEAEQLCRNIAIINAGNIVTNTDMKSLLTSLEKEWFVLDLASPVADDFTVDGVEARVVGGNLEVAITKGNSLNPIFSALSNRGVEVMSMRNKENRLESLFVSLLEKSND